MRYPLSICIFVPQIWVIGKFSLCSCFLKIISKEEKIKISGGQTNIDKHRVIDMFLGENFMLICHQIFQDTYVFELEY